jgi:hypothetical protein
VSEYGAYDIKQLWQMVDAAKQGLQPSYAQVAALDRAQQMLSGHAQSLETAREQLAAKWPPEANAASAAYLTELDRLIAAVKDTALSCAINVFHINTVSDAIVQAHETLKPLHDEYVKNEGALAKYDAEINAVGVGASAIPGGSTVAKGVARLFTSPPVEDGRQDELTKQAQQAMISLSGAAQDGATYIKPPAPYDPPTVNNSFLEDPKQIGSSGDTGGTTRPPTITSPSHARTPSSTSATREISSGSNSTPSGSDAGPILSGSTPAPVQPTPTPAAPVGPGIGIGSPSPAVSPAGPLPSILFTEGAPNGSYGGRISSDLLREEAGISRRPFGGTGTPRSGVISDAPDVNETRPSTPSRVNPPGGVIAQQPGVGGRAGSQGTGNRMGARTGMTDSHVGRRRRGTGETGGRQWDPDNPWEVDDGVDPIILPSTPPARIDPGPGIIGFDR